MNVEKTIEFMLARQAKSEARNEALHAEHKVEIKEIRRLLLRSAAMQVQDRKFTQSLADEMRLLAEEMRLLAEESRETKREVRDLTRALRGRPGNGASRH